LGEPLRAGAPEVRLALASGYPLHHLRASRLVVPLLSLSHQTYIYVLRSGSLKANRSFWAY
jgi:hypothetical protein